MSNTSQSLKKAVKFDSKANNMSQATHINQKTDKTESYKDTNTNHHESNDAIPLHETKNVPKIPIYSSYGSSPRFSSKPLTYRNPNDTKSHSNEQLLLSNKMKFSITPRPTYTNKYIRRSFLLPSIFTDIADTKENENMKGVIKKRTSEYAKNKQKIMEGRAQAYSTPKNDDDHLWMHRPQTIAQKQKYTDLVAIFRHRSPSPIYKPNKKI